MCVGSAVAAPSDPILVFNGNASRQPSNTYATFGVASGRPISSTTTLPGSLAGNACVLLNLNEGAFDPGQIATLSTYLDAGGRVIEIGEHGAYFNPGAFNGLSTALGSTMILNRVLVDPGFGDTTTIDADPLTVGVTRINYAASDTITLSGSARPLVRSRGDATVTIMAAQAIGRGTLVTVGDANAFQSPTGDAGVLVANICGTAIPDPDSDSEPAPPDVTPTPDATPTPRAAVPVVTECVSRRSVTLNWRVPANSGVKSIKVTLNGRAYKTLSANARKFTVALDGRSEGTTNVRVVARTKGRALQTTRSYQLCTPKQSSKGISTLYLTRRM